MHIRKGERRTGMGRLLRYSIEDCRRGGEGHVIVSTSPPDWLTGATCYRCGLNMNPGGQGPDRAIVVTHEDEVSDPLNRRAQKPFAAREADRAADDNPTTVGNGERSASDREWRGR
jgi:hypothetical protein